jgi:putative hydrolase of the HAD superfamily
MHRARHLWSAGDRRTAPALARLRRAGARLGVVSNSDGRVREALAAAGLLDAFDVVVDSAEAGVEKPDPRIFHLALEPLGIAPAEALHVGDVREVDVAGARRAGLAAALVGPGAVGDDDILAAATVADLVESLLAESAGVMPRKRAAPGEPSSSSLSNTSA